MSDLQKAFSDLKDGEFILIYDSDGRERETDLIIASEFMTADGVRRQRQDAGGLICTSAPSKMWKKLDLPFMAELLAECYDAHPVLKGLAPNDLLYDTKSSFSLTINHRKTFTGIPDADRALTISEFAKFGKTCESMSETEARAEFGKNFRAPGHVHLLNSQPGVLDDRSGHTELCTAILMMADLFPSATMCEMMGNNGHSMPKEETIKYAEKNGLVFLEGSELIDAWQTWKKRDE